jgi:hypothetical protein
MTQQRDGGCSYEAEVVSSEGGQRTRTYRLAGQKVLAKAQGWLLITQQEPGQVWPMWMDVERCGSGMAQGGNAKLLLESKAMSERRVLNAIHVGGKARVLCMTV